MLEDLFHIFHAFQRIFRLVCRSRHWVKWETEWSFDGKLYQEYSQQKLFKSDNISSGHNRK